MKKYELTNELIHYFGTILYRIRALKDFGNVNKGDLGGYVESESNLSHEGNCWVYGYARVSGDAKVSDNAWVYGNALVSGNAWVYGRAKVYGNALIYGNAQVYGEAQVFGDALVFDNAQVYGSAKVFGTAWVYQNDEVSGEPKDIEQHTSEEETPQPVVFKLADNTKDGAKGEELGSKEGQAKRYNKNKVTFSELPMDALAEVAKVLMSAKEKYPNNPDGSPNWSTLWGEDTLDLTYDCAIRHMNKRKAGHVFDPETKCFHIAHAAVNLLFMLRKELEDQALAGNPSPYTPTYVLDKLGIAYEEQ